MIRMALHWQILIAMLAGAALGLVLNGTTALRQLAEPVEVAEGTVWQIGMAEPVDVAAGNLWSLDSSERILIQLEESDPEGAAGDAARVRRVVVSDGILAEQRLRQGRETWPQLADDIADEQITRTVVPTLGVLQKTDPQAYVGFMSHGRSFARRVGDGAQLLGGLFLRMLKMISLPLIITSLVTGITGLGQAGRLGKMFGRTMLYYLTTSMLAITIGLLMVNLIRPGIVEQKAGAAAVGAVGPEEPAAVAEPAGGKQPKQGKRLSVVLYTQVKNLIPDNPFEAAANGQFLSIIAFSLAFGMCTILVGGAAAERISELFEAAFQVMMKLTMCVISLAPLGVFCLMLSVTATQGAGIFSTLGWYMLAVACALAVHALVVLPAILHFVARRSPRRFAQAMSPALLTAFSSASSNGTLPLTLTCMEQRANISNRVGSFVLPLGATINMDGTALYEVVAVLFIAQFSGIDLSLSQQVIVAFTALLASIGAAGIPHAGLVMMVIILQAVGIPTESQGMIIAVDRVLDMARTTVNVWSDSCGCAVISRFEATGGSTAALSGEGSVSV